MDGKSENYMNFVNIDPNHAIGLAYPCADGRYKLYDGSHIYVNQNKRSYYNVEATASFDLSPVNL